MVAASTRSAPSKFTAAVTVAELAKCWLQEVARHQVRASSLHTYRKVVVHLIDGFGTRRVRYVGPEVLAAWQSRLLDKYASSTVLNSRKVGRQILAEGVMLGFSRRSGALPRAPDRGIA